MRDSSILAPAQRTHRSRGGHILRGKKGKPTSMALQTSSPSTFLSDHLARLHADIDQHTRKSELAKRRLRDLEDAVGQRARGRGRRDLEKAERRCASGDDRAMDRPHRGSGGALSYSLGRQGPRRLREQAHPLCRAQQPGGEREERRVTRQRVAWSIAGGGRAWSDRRAETAGERADQGDQSYAA